LYVIAVSEPASDKAEGEKPADEEGEKEEVSSTIYLVILL
jgi:hypothetical protein